MIRPTGSLRARPGVVWWLAGAVASLLSCLLLARLALDEQRQAFDTDARIAHRLLSQRAAQHDAVLAMLNLLQPVGGDGSRPVQRLPAVYPQVLAVLQRERGQPWPDADLQAADARSLALGHAVPVRVDAQRGQATLLLHGEPASHALRIDLRAMVPWSEWPMGPDAPARVELQTDAGALVLQPGTALDGPWAHDFHKRLAAPSQPFDVVVRRTFGWGDLPWGRMAGVTALIAVLLGVAWGVRQQRMARRRAEELLRLGQVARLNTLGELAAGIAHELNQPLTAVLASTQAARRLLDDDPPDTPVMQQALDQAVAQARRASELLRHLRRSVERPDAGATAQPVLLNDVVADTLHLLESEWRARAVSPRVQADAGPVTVTGDAVAVQQIVHNLVMNALQALEQVAPGERRLALTIAAEEGCGRLDVADSGPGIAPEVLPRLFEPFFTTRPGGLGLGLSLCESLAQGQGGSLAAAAHPPRGACFTLRLPRHPASSAA